jgi:hypothetical protein
MLTSESHRTRPPLRNFVKHFSAPAPPGNVERPHPCAARQRGDWSFKLILNEASSRLKAANSSDCFLQPAELTPSPNTKASPD